MMFARVDGRHTKAAPGLVGFCPSCDSEVTAKCGQIKIWHWAHRVADCDPWSEPESDWHLYWKSFAPETNREVVMERDGVKHRADVVVRGKVLELQNSAISVEDIQKREAFYGGMAWLFHVTWKDRLHFGKRGFWWKHGSLSQLSITKPLFWDFGDRVVQVSLIEGEGPERFDGYRWHEESQAAVYTVTSSRRVIGRITRSWTTEQFVRAVFGRGAPS